MRRQLLVLSMCGVLAASALAACSGDDDDDDDTDTTEPAAETLEPPAGYEVVANGENDGLTWTVSEAPGDDGGRCWHLDTAPEVPLVQSDTECRIPIDENNPVDFNSEFPFETDATGDFEIVVGFVPAEIDEAMFAIVDGDEVEPVFLDKGAGIVVWAGKSRPFLGSVAVTLADGVVLDCGPGDIVSASQLEGKTEAEILDARQFVWTCIESAGS